MQIGFGMKAKCLENGFTGLVTSKCEHLSGMVQWGITPSTVKGEWKDAINVDEASVKVVGQGLAKHYKKQFVQQPQAAFDIDLGDTVKSRTSGAVGVAIRRTTFINGCIYYTVELPLTSDGKEIKTFSSSWQILEKLSKKNVLAEVASDGAEAITARKGGPSEPALRIS